MKYQCQDNDFIQLSPYSSVDSVLHWITATESERNLKNTVSVSKQISTKFCCWNATEAEFLALLTYVIKK